jgi:hypothetical protein
MAIAAFVLGLLGFMGISAILGIVFGVVAVSRVRRTLQGGKGLAIAGIVMGGVWVAVALIVIGVVVGARSSATPSWAPSVPGGQTVAPYALKTGDCFDNPAGTDVLSVVRTRCSQPHSAQVFATFNVGGSQLSYPGEAKLQRLAAAGCSARMGSVDSAKVPDSVNAGYLYPFEDTWQSGVRTITCILYSPTQNLTSSLLLHSRAPVSLTMS